MKVRTKKRNQMREKQLIKICYAAAAILITRNEDDLQRILQQVNITAQK